MMLAHRVSIILICVLSVLLVDVSESFSTGSDTRSPMRCSLSADKSVSRLSQPSYRPSPRQPSLASKAFATSISSDAYKGPGIRSRIYQGIKQRIDRKKKVEDISDIHDFQSLIANERESFVAVMFHAPFCKACQASLKLFQRMAKKNPRVKFVSVPLTEYNKDKLKGLGVEKFPFGHIYDPQKGLVDELPVLRKLIPRFEERLQSRLNDVSIEDDERS